jgi:hypothetical protein
MWDNMNCFAAPIKTTMRADLNYLLTNIKDAEIVKNNLALFMTLISS